MGTQKTFKLNEKIDIQRKKERDTHGSTLRYLWCSNVHNKSNLGVAAQERGKK